MRHGKLSSHNSICPLCSNHEQQEVWFKGCPNQNLSRITAICFANDFMLESTLCHCPICDFGYFYPRPTADFLQKFYGSDGGVTSNEGDAERMNSLGSHTFKADRDQIFGLVEQLSSAQVLHADRRVLEIGPGYSTYAQLFIEKGMDYWACEPGKETAEFLARNFISTVINAGLEQLSEKLDHSFDLVFTKDSLEHHLDPRYSIIKAFRLVKPGGYLVIVVPNLNSRSLRQYSVIHPYFAFPAHLNYFSPNSIERVFQDVGANKIRMSTFTLAPEIFYCMEAGIKYSDMKPLGSYLDSLSNSDMHERICVVVHKAQY